MLRTAGDRIGPGPSRRSLPATAILLLVLAGLLAGCGDDGGAGPTAEPSATTSSSGAGGSTLAGRALTTEEGTTSTDPTDAADPVGDDLSDLVSGVANLTWYTSYPEPGSDECIGYKGCEYAGRFAALPDVQSPEWVADTNIIAVHEKDFERLRLRSLLIVQGGREIQGVVYDKCADSDCDGCCTANLSEDGFLIDLEVHTMERFGSDHGDVEWYCLDCPGPATGDS